MKVLDLVRKSLTILYTAIDESWHINFRVEVTLETREFQISDALLIVIFILGLQTFGTYSDISLSFKLQYVKKHDDNDISGSEIEILNLAGQIMLCPVILSVLLTIPHWWKGESGTKRRILTFPLILLSFYPQYRVLRILFFAFVDKDSDIAWEENLLFEENVGFVGK